MKRCRRTIGGQGEWLVQIPVSAPVSTPSDLALLVEGTGLRLARVFAGDIELDLEVNHAGSHAVLG
jgi:hypothetical protein